MSITFVSALIDLCEDRSKDKSIEKYITLFEKIALPNLKFVIFVSKNYYDFCKKFENENIKLEICNLEDTFIYKKCQEIGNITIPSIRTEYHDTLNFHILMNSKVEFIKRAIDLNYFHSTHYSWIDFGISHIFKNPEYCLGKLNLLGQSNLKSKLLVFAGFNNNSFNNHSLFNHIVWRYCGGFFYGDKQSLLDFYALNYVNLTKILKTQKQITWEVNFWAYLELNFPYKFKPIVYIGDHNDTMLNFPLNSISVVASLTTIPCRLQTGECQSAINSLLHQVDKVYLTIAEKYKRWEDTEVVIPSFLMEEPYKTMVEIVRVKKDIGPVLKYVGALDVIPQNQWIIFVDDDQVYNYTLVDRMSRVINSINEVYQNRCAIISQDTDGGLIHGFVGNMAHKSVLNKLSKFTETAPEIAFFTDDQIMSLYYFFNNIEIKPTFIENYGDIYGRLYNNHEILGSNSLSSLNNRRFVVSKIAEYYKVKFLKNGKIDFL